MPCIQCGRTTTQRDGQTLLGGQRWRCNHGGRRCTERLTRAVSRHAFPNDIIALAIRWYLRYRLSYADVVEWLAERGISVDRSTIYRWVQRLLPLFGNAARADRRPLGNRWCVDAWDVRLQGRWTYVERAIDADGQAVDASVSERRNATAAQPVFERAIDETGMRPERVTTDKAKCYPPALRAVLPDVEHHTSTELNNGMERDHGHLKQRLYPMRGFKQAAAADSMAREHAFMRKLSNGYSDLTVAVPRVLRLATAWPQLTHAI